MKIEAFLVLIGIFYIENVLSQVPATAPLQGVAPAPVTTTPLPALTVPNEVSHKTRKLRWDLDEMMANGGIIDNQKLIGEVLSLVGIIQANLQTVPPQAQAQVTNGIATIQGKIQQMNASGKFDAGVLHDFNIIAETVDVAVNNAAPAFG